MRKEEIKLIGNYYQDSNGNRWDKEIYTKEQAEEYSDSLINCYNCTNCRSCRSCSYCSDFKTNPQRIVSKNIGSRQSQTYYYWNEEKEQIICGCFNGTLEEFKKAIKETHKDNGHAKEYFKWIEAVETYKELAK